jgi:stearoyl-CoA desaturase (delta-9 desaturase)
MDNTWQTIRFLQWVGLATDVVPPSAHLKAQAAKTRLITRGPDGVPVD